MASKNSLSRITRARSAPSFKLKAALFFQAALHHRAGQKRVWRLNAAGASPSGMMALKA